MVHLALCHHLLNQRLLLSEVGLQHIQLLLQLVNGQTILKIFALLQHYENSKYLVCVV